MTDTLVRPLVVTDRASLTTARAMQTGTVALVPTMGALRSHVKYRQVRGQLQGVTLPEATN